MTDNAITIQTTTAPAPINPVSALVPQSIDEAWRFAKFFSASSLVPSHFQGKPEDCFVAITMAMELKVNPLTCLQNIFMIGGRPGMSASLAIALANSSGRFAGPIRYSVEGKSETLAVTAYAPLYDGEIVECTVTYEMAVKEGWTRNPKYKSIPEQMLRYRAAKWLINQTCPEVLFGLDISEGPGLIPRDTERKKNKPDAPRGSLSALNNKIRRGTPDDNSNDSDDGRPTGKPVSDTEGSSGAVEG
jgi:hypothetical protein